VPPQALLGKDQFAVDRDFEYAAVRGDEGEDLDVLFKVFQEFVRQTDGARGVVSNRAVFDGDVEHGNLPRW